MLSPIGKLKEEMNKGLTVPKISRATIKQPAGQHKEHMLFNGLIKNIEDKRASLKKWQDALDAFERLRLEAYVPLLPRYRQTRADLVRRLDQVHADNTFTKKDRETLRDMIRDMSAGLLNDTGGKDLVMKEIYNRHSGTDYDAAMTAMHLRMKKEVEDELNIDLGDAVDFSSPASFEAHVDRVLAAKLDTQDREPGMPPESDHLAREAARAAHQAARHAKKAQDVSHSIREVYRKLASALHPDKETDPTERDRKTDLMKRVNVAYDQRNLLALLTLQLEIEQIDQRTIDNIPLTRLRHYNEVLREQSLELGAEIDGLQNAFKAHHNLSPFEKITPHGLLPLLRRDIKAMRDAIKTFSADIVAFRDVANVKAWLKAYRAATLPDDDDGSFM